MERILQTVAHNFDYMGSQHCVPIVALDPLILQRPTDDPTPVLPVLGHFWPLFFSEKCRNFCGQILPSLAHLNLGVAPPEAPHTTYGAHFSIRQDFL